MNTTFKSKLFLTLLLSITINLSAQHEDKPRPEAWNKLVYGARFMDRILPAPIYEGLETDTWGTDAVRPRDIHNGIEDSEWSYWGGKPVLGDDGKYHFFGCRWPESSEKGHMSWPKSVIFHAVGDRPTGPFNVKEEIAKGHFPEITKLSDGRWALFHFEGYYLSESLDGPWTSVSKQEGGFPNCQMGSVTLREDGSLLMFDRSMHVWIKENGSEDFKRMTDKGIYPAEIPGHYEDPVVWRTEVQYHLIVNDWMGRTAYHLRSPDGINWKEDPGEAYTIDFDGYEDGTKVGWYKYERPKVLQDKYGRPTHMYFAVIDTSKWEDLGNDRHSSKNISLPLVMERRLKILNTNSITPETKKISVRIIAEEGFNPHTDIDLNSLRFGASEEVDYGKGSPVLNTKKKGKDLILIFNTETCGFTESNFAGKLLGRTSEGKLLFGYARLPGVNYSPLKVESRSSDLRRSDNPAPINFWDEIPVSPSTTAARQIKDDYWHGQFQRVNQEVAQADDAEIVFFGNSITWMWTLGSATGQDVWNKNYSPYNPINMGNSGDITPVMLYRVTNGNLDFADGHQPKVAVLLCGTNNFVVTQSAGGDVQWELGADCPPEDVAHGVRAIAQAFRRRLPQTRVIMMGILPVSDSIKWGKCQQVNAFNAALSCDENEVVYVDLQDKFLRADGSINKELFTDGTHLTVKGYEVWAKSIDDLVTGMMKAEPLDPVKIMLIGGSITEGASSGESYRRYLDGMLRREGVLIDFIGSRKMHKDNQTEADSYEYDVDHEGHWGRNSDWLAKNMPGLLNRNVPDVAVISMGTEDIVSVSGTDGALTDEIIDNINSVIKSLRSKNKSVKIVLANIIPIQGQANKVNLLNIKISDYIKANSTTQSPIVLADQHTGFDTSTNLKVDGIMPKAAGAKKMARVFANVIIEGNLLENGKAEYELSETSGGLHGYIHYSTTDHPEGFRAGISFYTAVWPLIDKPLANFQIGLPSAWVAPENSDVDFPLCPEGTYARDNWDERGPTYASVFQTIEGGVGYWRGNKFRYNSPKFSMNATSSCYDFEIATPGWSFFYSDTALADDKMGIAQLSNRIIVPPDGLTFVGNPDGQFLGYSWMALPLLDAIEGPPPTGDQSWTLFLNTMNFKGPVAYYIAETWSKISKDYKPDYGRGLDARPAEMGGGAIEINTVPKIEARSDGDTVFYKIPRMKYPVDENGKTVLVQDVKYYSKDAIYNSFKSWRNGSGSCDGKFTPQGTWTPELFTRMPAFDQEGVVLENMDKIFKTEVFGDHIFGMQWMDNEATEAGYFPQYYMQVGEGKRVPVSVDDVPPELAAKEFMLAERGVPYTSPNAGSWANPGPASEPQSVTIADGSTVTYCWYRFIDQPSLQQFDWSMEKREKLQSLVEKIHRQWRIDNEYMDPPSTGTLVSLDPELIVQPPAGFEVGYVPIVIGQK